ncbi:MAG: ATP-binding cassette domain-containing protein [Paracoccus sp. (in: a-proteobacteria)]|uniref:ATP-binding cassette domain-containing protein n=1 Tax=unclassified Paracoccus (in: a-proteobacteria) TaxID=2688777 RepID=UPI000C37D691|nr:MULTISPECIES: ATP-binding cassette domain-containing protein [unclassified Paracoccus (in: a-proteobacteria)]MAN55909.1 phosphonate ABC transporter ATP-binding protein [Paracoccus sp. (in: a-proteobacteria)]MBA48171.1 phosphonate ABC transporter ATP-binding protein [Paracoccus sp. (in: a-proteobacteria)]MCS5603915.1 ATP-binding cassette domain-containing protein [Paracoccus sp. (in: a-proteobacteria)]MDB2551754.1 ATP-binding cassette domain-containing protein [Paracoccus sp. (in: a-proteobac
MQLLIAADLGYGAAPVLRDVTLDVESGQRVALLGRSGAGKSTLLAAIRQALLDRGLRVALVPQDHALVPQLSALHNVLMGRLDDHGALYNLATLIRPRRTDRAAALKVLARVGLTPEAERPVEALSGGQKQRVALARALYRGGDVLVADEPLSAVDPVQAQALAGLIGTTFPTSILALHDVSVALTFATRLIGLDGGRIALDMPAQDAKTAAIEALYAR